MAKKVYTNKLQSVLTSCRFVGHLMVIAHAPGPGQPRGGEGGEGSGQKIVLGPGPAKRYILKCIILNVFNGLSDPLMAYSLLGSYKCRVLA